MKINKSLLSIFLVFTIMSCTDTQKQLNIEVYETSASGNKLTRVNEFSSGASQSNIQLFPEKKYNIQDRMDYLFAIKQHHLV